MGPFPLAGAVARYPLYMELTARLPAMLAALMFGAMLVLYVQVFAMRRKIRDDRRRYLRKMQRNQGAPRRQRQAPPDA